MYNTKVNLIMIKIATRIIGICLILSTISCGGDDDPADLKISFVASFDGQVIEAGSSLEFEDYNICIEKFKFFISDLRLVGASNITLAEYEFAKFDENFTDPNNASSATSFNYSDITVANYSSIEFGIGVTPSVNDSTAPIDYSQDHALGEPSEYWADWGSYIFLKFEGKFDDQASCDKSFAYHIGGSESFRDISVTKSIDIKPGQNTIKIDIDLKDVLVGADLQVNIKEKTGVHSANDRVFMDGMMNNISKAFVAEN